MMLADTDLHYALTNINRTQFVLWRVFGFVALALTLVAGFLVVRGVRISFVCRIGWIAILFVLCLELVARDF